MEPITEAALPRWMATAGGIDATAFVRHCTDTSSNILFPLSPLFGGSTVYYHLSLTRSILSWIMFIVGDIKLGHSKLEF